LKRPVLAVTAVDLVAPSISSRLRKSTVRKPEPPFNSLNVLGNRAINKHGHSQEDKLVVSSGSFLLALLPKSVLAWLASEPLDRQGLHKLVLVFIALPLALCILILGVPLGLALMGVANVIYPGGEA
jgi:hypothetical protein